jgi:glycosyltransferase involved in cell wall biosynthesis
MQKLISIVTPCYNEEENIKPLCEKIKEIFLNLNYDYEHIVIDNKSIDKTRKILRSLAEKDKNLKIILNNKNYGHIRSPYHAIMESKGDATILLSSDFQDPLELIPQLISKWRNGCDVVMLKRKSSSEKFIMKIIRKFFYKFISCISEMKLIQNTTGSGIYDKKIIENLKKINDPYPYFRGLVTEFTDNIEIIEFHQPLRKFGKTKNNFYSLYDIAILGIIKHSKFPIRAMIILGFFFSIICLLIASIYFMLKILFWTEFSLGLAPLIIGIFGIASFQIFLLGILGEYAILILTHTRKLPLVVEQERINF